MSETPPPYGAQQPYGAPPPPPPAPGGYQIGGGDERMWATAAHWSALVAAFVALAFLGPLVVLFTKGTSSGYVRRHAVESLNFQLSMLIYGVVGTIIGIVLVVATLGIGLLVVPAADDRLQHLLAGHDDHRGDEGRQRRGLPLPADDPDGQLSSSRTTPSASSRPCWVSTSRS